MARVTASVIWISLCWVMADTVVGSRNIQTVCISRAGDTSLSTLVDVFGTQRAFPSALTDGASGHLVALSDVHTTVADVRTAWSPRTNWTD